MLTKKEGGMCPSTEQGLFLRMLVLTLWGAFFCCNSSARLHEDFQNRYIVTTPAGWVGAGDWSEFAGKSGVGYVAPGPQRTVSHVYVGPVDFRIPGKALFWVWTGPILLLLPLIGTLLIVWKLPSRSPRISVAIGGVLGAYFGAAVIFMGHMEMVSQFWAVLAGSPFALIGMEAGILFWAVVGAIAAGTKSRVRSRLLLTCLIIHYLAFAIAAGQKGWFTTQPIEALRWLGRYYPAWFAIWAVLFVSGEVYLWKTCVGRIGPIKTNRTDRT